MGFWLLWSQKTNSQPQLKFYIIDLVDFTIITTIIKRSNPTKTVHKALKLVSVIIDLFKSVLLGFQGWNLSRIVEKMV